MMMTVQAGPVPGSAPLLAGSLVAGIGCSSAAGAHEIIALVEACLATLHAPRSALRALASHARKAGNPALVAAADHFDVPLCLLDDGQLSDDIVTTSARVLAETGRPAIAEAVAAAAGPLVLAKRRSAHATCALSRCEPGFDPLVFGQVSSAAMAPSTLSTSSAGP
jgi:cobalamin biosynthesis protein CbiG